MAGKGRNSVRIETEIEKSREESNWKRVIELAEQLKSRNTTKEPLCNFLLGEGRLESFLDECPPIEANISKARSGLNEAKRCLLNAASEQGKKAGVALDSHLLLGKLHYAMGVWEESLSHYNEADLQSLTEKSLPSRSLRIVAESFAIKGLCLEKVPPPTSSKFKQVEWEGEVGHCFELAGDLALLYLQEQDKLQQQVSTISSTSSTGSHSPQPINTGGTRHMGPILETAIQRAPLLHVQAGRLPQAVATYRNMLCAVESSGTHGLRLALTRQLAELLLRGFTGTRYAPPTAQGQKKTVSTGSPWKPRLYTGLNLFVPRNECEEIILLLLISEAMAVRDAVLSQSPEFKEARIRALSNAITIYDLLSVTLMRWGQAALLHESLERALKFSFEEGHVWLQQALCLESMGRHLHAIAVIKEVVRLLPHKVTPCLIAARISYLHLNQLKEGVEWAQKALSRELAQPQNLLSRCHLMVGIGAHYAAMTGAGCHLKQEKQRLHQLASDSLHKAQQCDPNDHLTYYYLALNLGSRGHVTEAVANARAALKLCPEHSPSLHLLVLLLSAQKQLIEARSLLDSALQDFPDNLNLHYVKAYLELAMEGGEVALLTGKHMLALWKTLYEEQTNQTAAGSADHRLTVCDPTIGQNNAASSANADSRSVFQLYTSEMSDKDSSSLHGAHSLAASRVEQALSEVASSISGSQVGGPLGGGARTGSVGSQRAWQLQLHIWLLLAEIYLAMDQLASAVACLHEATNIFPLSHHIMYTRGLVHEQKHEFVEAKQCYQNAVSINPNHIKSLQHLGLMHHYLGSHRLAEKTLRDAAKIDPHAPDTWYNLGKVLEALGDCSRASDCMATALQVEMAAPILPYTTIPMVFD